MVKAWTADLSASWVTQTAVVIDNYEKRLAYVIWKEQKISALNIKFSTA